MASNFFNLDPTKSSSLFASQPTATAIPQTSTFNIAPNTNTNSFFSSQTINKNNQNNPTSFPNNSNSNSLFNTSNTTNNYNTSNTTNPSFNSSFFNNPVNIQPSLFPSNPSTQFKTNLGNGANNGSSLFHSQKIQRSASPSFSAFNQAINNTAQNNFFNSVNQDKKVPQNAQFPSNGRNSTRGIGNVFGSSNTNQNGFAQFGNLQNIPNPQNKETSSNKLHQDLNKQFQDVNELNYEDFLGLIKNKADGIIQKVKKQAV